MYYLYLDWRPALNLFVQWTAGLEAITGVTYLLISPEHLFGHHACRSHTYARGCIHGGASTFLCKSLAGIDFVRLTPDGRALELSWSVISASSSLLQAASRHIKQIVLPR